jgi:hypothetical protein
MLQQTCWVSSLMLGLLADLALLHKVINIHFYSFPLE